MHSERPQTLLLPLLLLRIFAESVNALERQTDVTVSPVDAAEPDNACP